MVDEAAPDGEDAGTKNRFAAAFQASRTAMLMTDPRRPDNPIVFANQAFLDFTGYPREEVVGRNCRFLQGPGTDRDDVARIGRALKAGEGIEIEILNYRKDGTSFWNTLVISPVVEAGKLVAFFGSQHDTSARRHAQTELVEARNRLDEEVARRTRDLKTTLERQAALLHEVDHRVKNNLQVVSSLVLLKARRVEDASARRALHNVAERISALSTVHRLLSFEGDDGGVDLRDFIASLSGELLDAVEPGRVTIDVDVERIGIEASKAAPLALLANELMTNALRHAFPAGRHGRVRVEAARRQGGLRLVVEDDGVGMDGQSPGREGFGHTLVTMLVRQLKGTLTWESAGPGTRAVVVLPLEEGRQP